MRERFCANGTVAEQLAKRAAEYKKTKSKRTSPEEHLKKANSLPRTSASAVAQKRKFFGLNNVGSACMLLLVAGTVLFSGAAIGSLREESIASNASLLGKEAKAEDTMVLFEDSTYENAQYHFETMDYAFLS